MFLNLTLEQTAERGEWHGVPVSFLILFSFVIVTVPVELLILEAAQIQFIVRAADLLLQNSS